MVSLDSILSWAIPLGIILWGLYLIRSPLANFFFWIRGLFGVGVNKIRETNVPSMPQNFVRDGNITYR